MQQRQQRFGFEQTRGTVGCKGAATLRAAGCAGLSRRRGSARRQRCCCCCFRLAASGAGAGTGATRRTANLQRRQPPGPGARTVATRVYLGGCGLCRQVKYSRRTSRAKRLKATSATGPANPTPPPCAPPRQAARHAFCWADDHSAAEDEVLLPPLLLLTMAGVATGTKKTAPT
jgi:hypothetical protein